MVILVKVVAVAVEVAVEAVLVLINSLSRRAPSFLVLVVFLFFVVAQDPLTRSVILETSLVDG